MSAGMMTLTPSDYLHRRVACIGEREFALIEKLGPKRAWETWKRGDHLLWLADGLELDQKLLMTAACECGERTLRFVNGELLTTLEGVYAVVRSWLAGEASDGEMNAASDTVVFAIYSATGTAELIALRSADALTRQDPASAAGWNGERVRIPRVADWKNEHRACADIVRKHIPWGMIEAALIKAGVVV